MNKYLLLILCMTFFFINSCSFYKIIDHSFINMKRSNLIFLNLNLAIKNIILEMLKSNKILIANNTILFINLLKNKTNFIVDNKKVTDLIKYTISHNSNKIDFLKQKIIDISKKKLGLSKTDLINTSTALLICRNNHIKYYLKSEISKKNELFYFKIQLILVQTGEIVFLKTKEFCS